MSLSSDFWKELKKLEEEDRTKQTKQSGSTTQKATGNSSKKSSGSVSSDFWNELAKDDDVAPIFKTTRTTTRKKKKEEEEEEKKRKWFDTSLFDDGYDFGDVTKTILGTGGDILENLASGVAGMGEKAVDTLAYIAPFAANAQFYQNGMFDLETEKKHRETVEQSKKDIGEWVAKDLYDEEALVKNASKAILGVDVDDYSVLGEKSDSLVQSGGQLLATAGLQAVGVPWFLTTGVTSFGSEAENAMNQGASYEEAGASAAISAGAEILSEKLSGGILFGGKALDDVLTKQISRSISNKAARTFAKLGLDMVGEGSEEIFSQVASNLGSALYKDESLGELLLSEEAFDEYLESFIGGAVLGGVSGGYKAVTSKTDYASGLTANEQKVVDQIYNERVSEAGKVSQKEKSKIYDQILSEMEKGYISTDDIERILGGESYNTYQNTVESEDSVLKEFEELGKKQNATLAEQSRYAELKEQVKNIRENSQRSQLRTKLSEDVLGMLEGDRLVESYNERSRRGQVYEADLTKYDSNQQKVIQKAVESGVLNNTRRTHEFVDIIAKISADKGVLFDFTNNAKLKESGFAVEGKQVNGYVTKDGITLNIDSPKAWQSTVGHEITHVLEGTELYNELQKAIFDYAKPKGEYLPRYNSLKELYKDVYKDLSAEEYDAKINTEITADLVGDLLFQDADFINNLSTTNRNVFQKIYDEIKYLYKVVTAGSKEARELEKVKRAFDKAYRESAKAHSENAETKYSLSDSDGRQLTAEQQEYFKDSKMRDENGNLKVMYHGSQDAGFHVFDSSMSDDGTSFFFVDRNDVAASYSGTTETYEARSFNTAEDANKFFAEIGRTEYSVIKKDGEYTLYDDGGEVATSRSLAEIYEEFCDYEGVGYGDANYKVYLNLKKPLEVDAEGRNWDNVSREFSQEVADRYNSLTAEEKAALFDIAGWGEISIFRDAKNNPPDAVTESAFEKLGDANIYDMFSIAEDNFSEETIKQFAVKQMNTGDYAQRAKEQGYDGVIFKNIVDIGAYGGDYTPATVAIAFDSNQIKSVANEKPTSAADIRYSLSDTELDNAYKHDIESGDEIGAQMMVEQAAQNAGYTIEGYHGTDNDFWTFSLKNRGRNGEMLGVGYYFTNDKEKATMYSRRTDNVKHVFLDIKKPTSHELMTISQKEWAKFLDYAEQHRDEYIDSAWKGNSINKEFEIRDMLYYDNDAQLIKAFIDSTADRNAIVAEGYLKMLKDSIGYDGLIYENGDVKVYVAFTPEQIKSADTVTYDDKGNIIPLSERFKHHNPDIRFSLSNPVEETKDLLAVHNLTSEQLLKSMELGGLPMPSIAVLKADSVHDEYGEVSLILPKGAIDPKANKANKVYGGDAWTPVYPRIEYKPSKAVEKKISDKYYGLAREIGYDAVRPLYNYVTDLERQLNNASGETAMLKELYDDTDMMNLYLQDSGKGKIDPIEKETVTKISPEQAEMNQFFIDALGEDVIAGYPTPKGESMGLHRRNLVEQHGEKIRTAYKRFFMERYDFSETEADNALDNTSKADLLHILRDAYQYTQNKGVTVKTEIDSQATQKAIREAAADGYKAWVDGLFKGVEEKTGIRNNQDYYTRTGNPRSWDALHWANTLENVVKVMKGQEETGTTSFSPYNSFASLAHKRYGSIAEVKADSNRLGKISEEEYEALGDSFAQRFVAIANSIKDPAERNPFIAADNAAEAIVDAVRTQKSKAGILKYLQEWSNRATKQTVEDIVSLVNDIANMPTGYFEAKPKRAVGFDEVGVFVIPYDADVKLKQELLNRGYSIAEYDPKVEGDRQRVVNQFEDLKFSLSNVGEEHKRYGNWNVYNRYATPATELRFEAPVAENSTEQAETQLLEENSTVANLETVEFPDDLAPVQTELDDLMAEADGIASVMEAYASAGDIEGVNRLLPEYEAIKGRIRELQMPENERVSSLGDSDAPPEMEAPFYGESEPVTVDNPFEDRNWDDVVGRKNRSVNAYMYEHPEVKPFFQAEAQALLGEFNDTQRGERIYNDEIYYASGGEMGWTGIKRLSSESMETMLDEWGMSYDEIERGLNAIIKDNGAENISAAKKVEFMLNDRLLNGYKNFYDKGRIEPNQEYIKLINEMQITSYSDEARRSLFDNADAYAPMVEENSDVAPVKPVAKQTPTFVSKDPKAVKGQTTMFEPPKPNPKVAKVLTEESQITKKKPGIMGKLASALVDKGMVFENYSHKTGNHEIQAKWNSALSSNTSKKAQYFMENGAKGVPALKNVLERVNKSGKKKAFFDYLYHAHNVDRMSREERFHVPNKTVFGETITADVSRGKVKQYERANPEFKNWANDIYAINKHMRGLLLENNLISPGTYSLWEKMYPHYVPIGRVDVEGRNISVPLDTKKTGVNAPIKRAEGGSSDMRPLDVVLAERIEQTYSAIARNSFGIELKNTMGTTINSQDNKTGVDEAIDTIEAQEDHLLKAGTMSSNPTFTVFENGKRVEFEITEDMYDALKPAGILGYRNQAIKAVGDARRNLLTQWNPVFALYRNPIKDLQEVAINSQHAVKTYLNIPNAIYQIATDGRFATEYHQNGGKGNSYFDGRTKKFKVEDNAFKKVIGMPIRAIENAGEFIEEIPRLAEYIASRKEGRSIDRSMLDAARVTTNFAAGGDFTKFLNSHGFTFLNASVQGASQHVRNFREAKEQGLKGYVKVLAKYTVAGLPGILLNNLLWDDDEDYEELNDYVKQNYYVVAKTEDGKFVRIPKGRTAAVMQNAMEQMQNLVTGDDEADFGTFFELFMNNIAPNNPIENNILAPIFQAVNNEAWYGGDLVPSRLQKLPAEEQFDESTDDISKWLGEKTGLSPYKINYLIDQYSGGLGDMILPTLTPEAESGDNSLMGNILAPWKKEITTDKVLNNKNPGDFYDLRDELEVKSNSRNATEEDAMRTMYMDSVSWEMSDLYKQKREVQSSDLPDDEKYEEVRNIQEQINAIAENALNNYSHVTINGLYSEAGDRRYNKDAESGKWYEIKPKNADGSDNWYYQKEQEVTKGLGISYEEYWNNRDEYNYAYDKPGKYAIAKAVGGYDSYMEYYDVLENWQSDSYLRADKDSQGNSISGSRKEKVIEYINGLDADYGEKIILYRTVYESKADKKAYNMDIINYLNSRDDISYDEMKSILEELGMEVDDEGNISWD